MKLIQTVSVFDQGNLIESPGWGETHALYQKVILSMTNPAGGSDFAIRAKTRRMGSHGELTSQWNRNGVGPIKAQFQKGMAKAAWKTERRLSLKKYLAKVRHKQPIRNFPEKRVVEGLHDSVGDFDFWYKTKSGFRSVIEWETGNVSSSHRSLNKVCLALQAGLVDAGILIVPSRAFYGHLTDRIGNWTELCPYLAFWQSIGLGISRGLLAISVVEHDRVVEDDSVPYLQAGPDGRSAEGARKLRSESLPGLFHRK